MNSAASTSDMPDVRPQRVQLLSKQLFFAGSSAPDLLHRFGNCHAIFQLFELRGRSLVQVIYFERLQRNEGVQSIEFLAVRQLLGEHDLAILSELRLSR